MGDKRNPEDYLVLLANNADDYIKQMNRGYHSVDKKLTFGLILFNMIKQIGVNIRNIVFLVKTLLPILMSLSSGVILWLPFIQKDSVGIYGKIIINVLLVVGVCMYLRNSAIKQMTTPGNKLFNLGAYEKYKKEEFNAFSPVIEDSYFSFKQLKEDLLKVPKMNQRFGNDLYERVEEQKARYEDFKLIMVQKEEEIKRLNKRVDALQKEAKEDRRENHSILQGIEELKTALKKTEMEKEVYSRIVYQTKLNMQLFVKKEFNVEVLTDMTFDYPYAIYESDKKIAYKYLTSKGINQYEIKLDKKALSTAKSNIGTTSYGDTTIAKAIAISRDKIRIVILYLSDEEIDILNNDLHHLNLTTKIKIETTFNQFWICLLIQSSVEELKNKIEGDDKYGEA